MKPKLLVLAPTRRSPTETFVRANLERFPFPVNAYFGDEYSLTKPFRFVYGLSILVSKGFTRLRLLRLSSVLPSLSALLLVRRHRPTVLMVEFGFHAVRVMEVAAWTNIPMIVHFRGADASASMYIKVLQERYRRLFQLTSGIVVKNAEMRQVLLALGAHPDSIIISPSGADQRLFYGSHPGNSPPRFVSIGRFVAKKGPLETLEAFHLMLQSTRREGRLEPTLVMVGEGPLLALVRARVQQLGLSSMVQLPGLMNRQEIASLLREARAFVQHSMVAFDGDREGAPVAVMEAQLSGLPVVATRHAGIPDIVVDGTTGFLVDEGDVVAMAGFMSRLAKNPDLAASLGKAAQKRALHRFTIDVHLSQLIDMISLLHSSSCLVSAS